MNDSTAVRLTAWSALVGAVFACLNVAFSLAVTGEDTSMIFHGATVLALPTDTRDLYRYAMLSDILGFYLPFLLIGAYLRCALREQTGALGDAAFAALVVYVVVGITGAAMQLAVLHPLAHLHEGGDDAVRAATEAAWAAVSNASQNGLWWCEGPLMMFWALVVARPLKEAGWGRSLLLKVTGWTYGLFFLFGFFQDLYDLTELMVTVAVLVFPAWMFLFGWQLLRRPQTVRMAAPAS